MGPLKFFQVVSVPPASAGGYPTWQVVPISGGSGIEPPRRTLPWWVRQKRGLARRWHALGRRVPERLWLWWVVTLTLFSPTYAAARYAVRKVNADPSMPKGPLAYAYMQNKTGLYHPLGENFVRSTEAVEWTGHWLTEEKHTAPTWRRHLACEIAYLALKER